MQYFTTDERYDASLCVFSVLIYLTDEKSLNQALFNLQDCLNPIRVSFDGYTSSYSISRFNL